VQGPKILSTLINLARGLGGTITTRISSYRFILALEIYMGWARNIIQNDVRNGTTRQTAYCVQLNINHEGRCSVHLTGHGEFDIEGC